MDKKLGFVYRWRNIDNGRWYIGSHVGDPNIDDGYVGSGLYFRNAVKKHGLDRFVREILYYGESFREEEERLLRELDAVGDEMSYNLKNEAVGGAFYRETNGMFGKKLSDASKEKIGKTLSTGVRWGTPGKKEQQSLLVTGEGNGMFGRTHSEWSIEKMRKTRMTKNKGWEHLGNEKHQRTPFLKVFRELADRGKFVRPRGQLVIELENFSFELPPFVRFQNFECRKLNLNYIREEFLWYLNADRHDLSITDHAKIWKGIVDLDGSLNSNYGQYIFRQGGQFDRVVETLEHDRDSRRASMMILNREHLLSDTKDVPCTYALNFRIRDEKLNMSVHMRSQDAIYGMGNDVPTFSFIHEMVLNALKEKYPDLGYGSYFHVVDSFHVYERHFEMLSSIVGKDIADGTYRSKRSRMPSSYMMVLCPSISGPSEVEYIRNLDFTKIPEGFRFAKWLVEHRQKRDAEESLKGEKKAD